MSPELASSDRSASQCRISSAARQAPCTRSEEHTSELQSQSNLVCRLLLEKKKITTQQTGPRCTSKIPIELLATQHVQTNYGVDPQPLPPTGAPHPTRQPTNTASDVSISRL